MKNHADAEQLRTLILDLVQRRRPDQTRHIRHFLSAIHEFLSDLQEAQTRTLLRALVDVGDEVIRVEREERGLFEIPIFWMLRSMTYLIIKALPVSDWIALLLDLVETGKALCFITTAFGLLWHPPGGEQRLVGPPEEAQLKSAIAGKLLSAAESGTLEDAAVLGVILSEWEEMGGSAQLEQWLATRIVRDEFFLKICRGYSWLCRA